MAQKINPTQGGEWVEIGRYTGSVTTTPVSVSFANYKFIKVVVESNQTTTQAVENVLQLQFNNLTGATDYGRQMQRFSSTGVAAFSGGDTNRIIVGVSGSQNTQGVCQIEIPGTGWRGWNEGYWRFNTGYAGWANSFGKVWIRSAATLTSVQLSSTSPTYSVELIVYGHN